MRQSRMKPVCDFCWRRPKCLFEWHYCINDLEFEFHLSGTKEIVRYLLKENKVNRGVKKIQPKPKTNTTTNQTKTNRTKTNHKEPNLKTWNSLIFYENESVSLFSNVLPGNFFLKSVLEFGVDKYTVSIVFWQSLWSKCKMIELYLDVLCVQIRFGAAHVLF